MDGNRQSAADKATDWLNRMDAQKLRQEATEEISGYIDLIIHRIRVF